MPINFDTKWLGGRTGREVMGDGVTSLYYTMIVGELPDDGVYTGPGVYDLVSIPRGDSLVIYINGRPTPATVINETLDGAEVQINKTGTGTISATYSPVSDLVYFGDNEKKIENGVAVRSPLLNIHVTNIMFKMAQVEYVGGLPISLWSGREITSRNHDEYNFLKEAAIVYSMKTRMNEIALNLNEAYVLDIFTLDVGTPDPRRIGVEDIMEMRVLIESMQAKLQGVFE